MLYIFACMSPQNRLDFAAFKAVHNLDVEKLNFLLSNGVSANAKLPWNYIPRPHWYTNITGMPLLHFAVEMYSFSFHEGAIHNEKQKAILKILIDSGADINAEFTYYSYSDHRPQKCSILDDKFCKHNHNPRLNNYISTNYGNKLSERTIRDKITVTR